MKIALILVVLLVLISAETVGGTVTANVKEVTHQDTTKKTEEKVNQQQGHDKVEMKENVENDNEKKNTHLKDANHQSIKGKNKAHSEKIEANHMANLKDSTKVKTHGKDTKNRFSAKKTDKKNVHPHRTKGKETHIKKRVEGSHKTKNMPHQVNPKKNHPNDKAKQHIMTTHNPIQHIETNQTAKVVEQQQKTNQKYMANITDEKTSKETKQSLFNSTEVIAMVKEQANTSISTPLLSDQTKAEETDRVIEEQESSTDSDDNSEEQSLDSDTSSQTDVEGGTAKNEQNSNQTVKQDTLQKTASKTQVKQTATKENNSTLLVKESKTSNGLLRSEENKTTVQEASVKKEKTEENHTTVKQIPIKKEINKTAIIKTNLPKPQTKESIPKQQETQTPATTKNGNSASHQQNKSSFQKTETVTIDASASKESQKAQTNIQPPQTPKHQAVQDKKETVQPQPSQIKVPQQRHLKAQQATEDDIDKLLKQVNAKKAMQKSKIADQILDLQVKLHQQPEKAKENNNMTLYIIFVFFAIIIAVPIIKCLTKTNEHPEPGLRIVQFQEEDSTRLSGPQFSDNLEEMI